MSSKRLQKARFQINNKHCRNFSEEFKKEKVKQIIGKQISIQELSQLYEISRQLLYNWLYKYSPHHKRGTRQVVQMESEALKTKVLLSKVAELERIIGQKQLAIDLNDKLLELASEEVGYDIKKKYEQQLSNGFGKTQSTTPTK